MLFKWIVSLVLFTIRQDFIPIVINMIVINIIITSSLSIFIGKDGIHSMLIKTRRSKK